MLIYFWINKILDNFQSFPLLSFWLSIDFIWGKTNFHFKFVALVKENYNCDTTWDFVSVSCRTISNNGLFYIFCRLQIFFARYISPLPKKKHFEAYVTKKSGKISQQMIKPGKFHGYRKQFSEGLQKFRKIHRKTPVIKFYFLKFY